MADSWAANFAVNYRLHRNCLVSGFSPHTIRRYTKKNLHSHLIIKTNYMKQSPLWKLSVAYLVTIFPAFYGTGKSVIVFTKSRHWSLSWVWWVQAKILILCILKTNLMLSFHLQTPGSYDSKIWSWVPRDSELRITVLGRTSSDLPDRPPI
jgi:hypothetical protein